MSQLYKTCPTWISGNVIYVHHIANGKAFLNRVGYIDSDGDSQDVADERWAVVAEDWPQTAIDSGILTLVYPDSGGNFITEERLADMLTGQSESRVENTFEILQRKTRRGRGTLNAY